MTRITWDAPGKRLYESGIDRCVLYVPTPNSFYADNIGVPWNGVTAIDETSQDGTVTPYYFNGVKYAVSRTPKDFAATLKAYTYPDEFLAFDGYAQLSGAVYADEQMPANGFHLAYRTWIGDDLKGKNAAYKIHLLYNLSAVPTTKSSTTLGDDVDPADFSWDISGVPENPGAGFLGIRPAVHFVLDSRKIPANALFNIENLLYGNPAGSFDSFAPRMPDPIDIAKLVFYVEDNGDGTATIYADDSIMTYTSATEVSITWPGVTAVDSETVLISDKY